MGSTKDPPTNDTKLSPVMPFDKSPTVILNVGGVRHETTWATLQSRPDTKLSSQDSLAPYYRPDKDDYYFDRSPRLFETILNLYRVGELHMEKCRCSRELWLELEFWEIDPSSLESCCWLHYQSQCDSNTIRKDFEMKKREKFYRKQQEATLLAAGCCRCQPQVWALLNDPHSSTGAMVWAVFSMLVLFLSIFTLCASTSPAFKTKMSLTQYAQYYNVPAQTLAKQWKDDYPDWAYHFRFQDYLGDYYDDNDNSTDSEQGDSDEDQGNLNDTDPASDYLPRKRRDLIDRHGDVKHHADNSDRFRKNPPITKLNDSPGNKQNAGMFVDHADGEKPTGIINRRSVASHSAINVEDSSPHHDGPEHRQRRSATPAANATRNGTATRYHMNSLLGAPNIYLERIDMACYAFFGLEIILRFLFCPSKKRFFLSILDVLDIMLVAIYLAEYFINKKSNSEAFRVSILDALYIFRVLRIFRIFRLGRHHKGLEVLVHTVKASLSEIVLLFLFLLIGILFFGSMIYFTDHDDKTFKSIGHSFWWAIITMTTVGYGDMYPTSAGGKVVGTICAICGVLLIAFTVPIIVNNFMMFYDLVEYGKDPADENAQVQRSNTGRSAKVADEPKEKLTDVA